jgi:hypothetical protein
VEPTRARLEAVIRAAVPVLAMGIIVVLEEAGRRWW